MSSRRIEQVNSLIQEELGKILLREFDVPAGTLLTITHVKTSEDRDHANVSVSIYPETNARVLFERLAAARGAIQHILDRTLIMEHVPTIIWRLDKEERKAAEVEKLIEGIREQGRTFDN
jgi:ribosome-binding factor A